MQRFFATVCSICMLFCLAACGGEKPQGETLSVTLVAANGTETKSIVVSYPSDGEAYAADVLAYAKEQGVIDYAGTNGAYGLYLDSIAIGGLTIEGNALQQTYIAVYTSVKADWDTSEWAASAVFDGVEAVTAMVGLSSMQAEDGCIYYFASAGY